MTTRSSPSPTRLYWLVALLCLLGGGLRLLRLGWQPLWWDEGYSVYFATEPLAAMLRLTAADIHPPLYYALLHLWLTAFGSVGPIVLRAFSVLIGFLSLPLFWWLARALYPDRPRAALLGLLLLALSPIHIFYSQEVRMYGLEMLLGMASSGFFWLLIARAPRRPGWWLGYLLATTALLYTEYYAALLPFSHCVWAVWRYRRTLRRLLPFTAVWGGVALAYLPWLLYAVPELIPYVSQKVVEDADRPLGLAAYGLRHLRAFIGGHIGPEALWQSVGLWLALAAALLLLAGTLRRSAKESPPSPTPALWLWLLLPFAVGFALNLRLPFFPEGGERVLLFVLPYFLLLLAGGVDGLPAEQSRRRRGVAGLGMAGLLFAAATGVWAFYTLPRYVQDDYRPLIRQSVQQGSDTDTVLAVFPWQVGYWRAYAPVWGRGERHGPWPLLTPAPAWGGDVQAAIDAALEQGKLWFPAHLALGGILEGEIEAYLRSLAAATGPGTVNFENRWYSPTTRLSGWARATSALLTPIDGDFSAVGLAGAGIGAESAPSANPVVAVALDWAALPADDLRVTLRLEDDARRVWAQRDYAPLGSWPRPGAEATEQIGLLIPPGIAPGSYRVAVGVGPADEEWLLPVGSAGGFGDLLPVAPLQITAPDAPLPALRLPLQLALPPGVRREGVEFLGLSGVDPRVATLAGAQMNLSLFLRAAAPIEQPVEVYVSLLDREGGGVAGWEGWPLPDYPLSAWPPGAALRVPVQFYLPASLTPGEYRLVAGLRSPADGQKSDLVELARLPVVRREASFAPPQPRQPLDPPVIFGAHAALVGYDLTGAEPGGVELTLYWRVEQTLLPPHHVFVHVRARGGALLGQDDGVPGRNRIAAPTNTWIPGEFVADPRRLALPSGRGSLAAQVGLYEPLSGVRLPVSVGGETIGDTFPIPLALP